MVASRNEERPELPAPEFLQVLSSGFQRFILFAEAKAHSLRAERLVVVERRARNDGDADIANEMAGEFDIVSKTEIRDIAHYVIRAFWSITFESGRLQNRNDVVAFLLVIALEFVVIILWQA